MRWQGITALGVVIAACLIALRFASNFLVDLLWFSDVGYLDVFWTIFSTKVILFLAVFVCSTVVLWVNGALAFWFARHPRPWLPVPFSRGFATDLTVPATWPAPFQPASAPRTWRWLIAGGAVVLGLVIAAFE